jgi:hypothetical protein
MCLSEYLSYFVCVCVCIYVCVCVCVCVPIHRGKEGRREGRKLASTTSTSVPPPLYLLIRQHAACLVKEGGREGGREGGDGGKTRSPFCTLV